MADLNKMKVASKSIDSKKTKSAVIPIMCLTLLSIFIIVTGIKPAYRIPWILETSAVVLLMLVLVFTYNKFRFSNFSYILITIFLFLPMIGAYYSFGSVPYGELLDFSGNGRNNFDRLIHFLFGVCIAIPLLEILSKKSGMKKSNGWLYVLPVFAILGAGAIYEIIEWQSAMIFAPEDATIFVGTSGDIWDAQKDMFLSGLSSTITMVIFYLINLKKEHKYKTKN